MKTIIFIGCILAAIGAGLVTGKLLVSLFKTAGATMITPLDILSCYLLPMLLYGVAFIILAGNLYDKHQFNVKNRKKH